ncbi:MAG TPA: hypothetical protein VJ508_18870 [Saprospiraceae bacterium]|nr:hypothetical protein [Saprospiraceae bacterium]
MKNLLIVSCFMLAALTIRAQVAEETRVMSAGSQPALTIMLPGADTKFTDAEWKDYMKPYGKVSRVKQAKENMVEGAQILDIGGVNRLNVYSLSESSGDGTKLLMWIDMGGGFVNSTTFPKEYAEAVKFLQTFGHQVKVDQISIDLENQQKQLTKDQNALAKLQRENDNLHKVIEDAQKRIAEAESDIAKNLKDQEAAQKEIDAQKTTVDTVQKKLDDTKAHKPY